MTTTVSFANGGEIPVIGFGTWQITGRTCVDAVRTALRSDYRHVDTATMYGNEAEVGAAWQDSGLARDDVFVTTKLPPRLTSKAHRTLEQSLRLILFLTAGVVFSYMLFFADSGEPARSQAMLMGSATTVVVATLLAILMRRRHGAGVQRSASRL